MFIASPVAIDASLVFYERIIPVEPRGRLYGRLKLSYGIDSLPLSAAATAD